MTDVHRCARGDRCYTAAVDDQGARHGAICDRALCDVCTAAVARALDETPRLYVQLRLKTLDRDNTGPGEKVTRSAGSPMPLNARALDLGEQLWWLLTDGEDTVRRIARLTPAQRTGKREGRQITDAAALLAAHLSAWISADPAGPGQLLDWRSTVRRLPGFDPTAPKALRRYDEPCMYCGVKAVTYRSGDDLVHCQSCGASWERELYTVKAAAFSDHLKRLGETA